MNACRAGYKALYLRLPAFFVEYALAAARNKQQDYTKKLQNVRLLILDEFLLVPVKPPKKKSLLELLERRSGNTSTIYCSQYSFAGWHEQLGGGAIADSILDRIIHGSYKLEIKGDVSMRQRLAEAEKAEDFALAESIESGKAVHREWTATYCVLTGSQIAYRVAPTCVLGGSETA